MLIELLNRNSTMGLSEQLNFTVGLSELLNYTVGLSELRSSIIRFSDWLNSSVLLNHGTLTIPTQFAGVPELGAADGGGVGLHLTAAGVDSNKECHWTDWGLVLVQGAPTLGCCPSCQCLTRGPLFPRAQAQTNMLAHSFSLNLHKNFDKMIPDPSSCQGHNKSWEYLKGPVVSALLKRCAGRIGIQQWVRYQ